MIWSLIIEEEKNIQLDKLSIITLIEDSNCFKVLAIEQVKNDKEKMVSP